MKTQMRSSGGKGATKQAGFTLVEIMVVIVILGILATIVGTNVLRSSDEAHIGAAELQVKELHGVVKTFMIQNHSQLPTWEELIRRDEKGHRWIESEEPLVDPWGNEYVITTHPDFEHIPEIRSWGPDGQADTEDDITNETIMKRKER